MGHDARSGGQRVLHRLTPIAVAIALFSAACGDPTTEAGSDAPLGFVPDHQPAGVALDVVNEHLRDYGGGGRTTLLTDAQWAAGQAGRAGSVAYQDDYSGLPFDRDSERPTNTTVGELPATSGRTGDVEWVTWDFCPGDGCDHENHAAVVGINVN